MAVTGSISLNVTVKETNTANALAAGQAEHKGSASWTIASGTGSGQADKVYSAQRTLAPSATEDLDLNAVLAGVFGDVLAMVKIKAVYVQAVPGNTNDVQVTRPAANGLALFMAAGDGIALGPGQTFLWVAPTGNGKAVAAGTGDLLTVTNSAAGTSVTYKIIVIGTSA